MRDSTQEQEISLRFLKLGDLSINLATVSKGVGNIPSHTEDVAWKSLLPGRRHGWTNQSNIETDVDHRSGRKKSGENMTQSGILHLFTFQAAK